MWRIVYVVWLFVYNYTFFLLMRNLPIILPISVYHIASIGDNLQKAVTCKKFKQIKENF